VFSSFQIEVLAQSAAKKKSRRPTGGANLGLFLDSSSKFLFNLWLKKYLAALRAAQILGYF